MNTPAPLLDPAMEVVRVRGPDAARFLHAQFTNDVAAMPPGGAELGAWCSPRGRVRHLFWIVRRAGEAWFDLATPLGEAAELALRLRTFILRAKVTAERAADRVVGAAGREAAALIDGWAGGVPAAGRAVESGERVAFRPPGGPVRFLAFGPDPPGGAPKGSDAKWRRLEIASGIAWIDDATRETFLPQMLDLDRLGAVSFDKGCYPGQEVVARAHYLGRVKRRLYRGRVGTGTRPAPGDRIRAGDAGVGLIVASAPDEDGEGYDLLAVVDVEHAGGGLETADGRLLAVSPAAAAAG